MTEHGPVAAERERLEAEAAAERARLEAEAAAERERLDPVPPVDSAIAVAAAVADPDQRNCVAAVASQETAALRGENERLRSELAVMQGERDAVMARNHDLVLELDRQRHACTTLTQLINRLTLQHDRLIRALSAASVAPAIEAAAAQTAPAPCEVPVTDMEAPRPRATSASPSSEATLSSLSSAAGVTAALTTTHDVAEDEKETATEGSSAVLDTAVSLGVLSLSLSTTSSSSLNASTLTGSALAADSEWVVLDDSVVDA
jgi:hypothetical protein